jgi:hypothetical protein
MTWSLVIDSGRAPTAIPLEREMAYRLVLQAEIIEVFAWNAFAVAAVLAGLGVWGVAGAQIVLRSASRDPAAHGHRRRLTTWAVGLPLLATDGVIGLGVGQAASGVVDLVFLTAAVWGGSYRRGFSFTTVPVAAVVVASVPAWLIAIALGKGLVALLASVATGELLYGGLVTIMRRPTVRDAFTVGWRAARSFVPAA